MSAVQTADVTPVVPEEIPGRVADVASFLAAHVARRGHAPASHFYLSGATEGDRVELDEKLFGILVQAVDALQRGESVGIVTSEQEVTTQQAAEFLGVSRPTVVRLIEQGELPARVPGAVRRKLRLTDVLAYRDEMQTRRQAFIQETSETFADLVTVHDEVDVVLQEARKAR